MSEAPHRLVERLEQTLRGLESEFHDAYWRSQVDATRDNERRRAELELELRRVKGDPDALQAVNDALSEELHDPILRRQLRVLWLSLTGNQMDETTRAQIVEISSAVESDFAAYRPELGGRRVSDNDIDKILKTSEDQDLRRRAWEASKEIGAIVAERVRELARLRNSAARNLGFADYYTMSLELQEIPEAWLSGMLQEVERLTDEPFRRWKGQLDARLRGRFGVDRLYPWHYSDPFFQTLPRTTGDGLDELLRNVSTVDLAQQTFAKWDIDLSGVIARSDLYPREGKSQHAFCLDVDRSAADVRILANVVPGERWVEVMLHECGHAAYDISIDPRLPYLLRRPAHIFVTEAMALLSGRLVHDPDWLLDIAGLPRERIASMAGDLVRAPFEQSLLFARWVLVMASFERAFYADPEADLDAQWWELVRTFQLVDAPEGRRAPDWAAKVHTAVAPVYYHNYLLGDVLASQLRTTVDKECGGLVGVAQAGHLLRERLFRPGDLLNWDALIEEATGRPLSAQDFASELERAIG